ncbi:MAG TPA: glycosyltransferase family 2 protein [Flavobacteriales bacterium]|nr:glycosyltransferase family 2 protein [Flavobacteriales bacterium]
MSIKISILVVNYNTKEYIVRCIESIFASNIDKSQYEILVWDNNSTDGSVELIKSTYPDVKLFKASYNYGFAVGMNKLYAASSGELIMTFNPDAEVEPNTLESVIAFMNEHTLTGMMGMSVKNTQELVEIPFSDMPRFDKMQLFKLKQEQNNTLPDKPFAVNYIWGTGIVVRRELLGDQFFEERAFLFWEEYDLAKKIKRQNVQIMILPSITFIHHASVSFKFNKERTRITRSLSVAWAYFYKKKEFGVFSAKIQTLSWMFDNGILASVLGIKNLFSPNDSRKLMIVQYNSVFKTALRLLFAGNKAVFNINKNSARQLNGGLNPVYPPVFESIL